jgi:hypothetical protein
MLDIGLIAEHHFNRRTSCYSRKHSIVLFIQTNAILTLVLRCQCRRTLPIKTTFIRRVHLHLRKQFLSLYARQKPSRYARQQTGPHKHILLALLHAQKLDPSVSLHHRMSESVGGMFVRRARCVIGHTCLFVLYGHDDFDATTA